MIVLIHIGNHSNTGRKEHRMIGIFDYLEEVYIKLDEFKEKYRLERGYDEDEVVMSQINDYNMQQAYEGLEDVWVIHDRNGNPLRYWRVENF